MASLNIFKKRWFRILFSIIILLLLIGLYFYFAVKQEAASLEFLNRYFTPAVSANLIIIIPILVGLIIVPFLINFLTTDLGNKLDEKPKEPETPSPAKVEITVKTENLAPEAKQPEIVTPPDSKFYPVSFFPDLKFFVGRKRLIENLEKKLKTAHRASIHDISGLGKTFSTYKFAEKNQDKYTKIFFVRANRETMLQSLAEIGVWLNPSLKSEQAQAKQAEGFKQWLEKNEKWLVIYDNVDIPSELKPYVPANLKGDCLFSSNFPSVENLAPAVSIDKLSKAEASQLLFSRANNDPQQRPHLNGEEKTAFEKIIEEVDGHPLSLNTTGAFIAKNSLTFIEYLRKLDRTPEILLENDDEFDDYHRKSALKAFSIALDDIRQTKPADKFKDSANLAEKLLSAVSFIAPDDIPETLLKQMLSEIADIDFEIAENEDLWLEIRVKLSEYDLVKYDKHAKILTTHRLIQKVIQTRLSEHEKTAIYNAALTTVNELFPASGFYINKECEIYFPHAAALIETAEKNNFSSKTIADIYQKIGRHLRAIVKYQESTAYLDKAITFYRNSSEYENNLAISLNELALNYKAQGRYNEAIEKYEEALQIGERTNGKEHPSYAVRLNNLANVYQSQDKYDEAIEKYEEALRIDERTIGKEHPDYAIDLSNLANVYKAQGKYDEAIEKLKEALRIGEQTIGKEHPNYATRLNNLANVYKAQGKYDEAIEKYEEALRIGEQTIGKEHPSYATRLNNLALVYEAQDRYDEALILYREALKIDEQTLLENHPYTNQDRESIKRCAEILKNQKKD